MKTLDIDDPILEIARIQAEFLRRTYVADPAKWCQEVLGDILWSKQKEILAAIAKHRRVAVKSCHEIGKSFIASDIVGWWIGTAPLGKAFVVTSAPSGHQVRAILWREISRVHTRGKLPGRMNQTEWLIEMAGGKEEQVAFGRKPDDMNPDAFQGIHAERVLVVFDEANGIRGPLWDAADSLIANDQSKMLAIGNPDDPSGEFYDICKPGSGWHVIEIGAFGTPNFTGEEMPAPILSQLVGRTWVEEKRRKWAPTWHWVDVNGEPSDAIHGEKCVHAEGSDPTDTNPLWQSKILGKFPAIAEVQGLIPISWITAAQLRDLSPLGPSEIGTDVGGGGDTSCTAHRRGPVVRVIREDHNPDTMETCGNLIADLRTTKATHAKVDMIGIGRGVVDRAVEIRNEEEQTLSVESSKHNTPSRSPRWNVIGINVAEKARDQEAYANLRAELWWEIRERFENGTIDIDPKDEDLAAELVEIRYKRTSSGKIQIESKDEAKKRGIPSPNRADALMLAFAPNEVHEEEWVTW